MYLNEKKMVTGFLTQEATHSPHLLTPSPQNYDEI